MKTATRGAGVKKKPSKLTQNQDVKRILISHLGGWTLSPHNGTKRAPKSPQGVSVEGIPADPLASQRPYKYAKVIPRSPFRMPQGTQNQDVKQILILPRLMTFWGFLGVPRAPRGDAGLGKGTWKHPGDPQKTPRKLPRNPILN